MKPTKAYSPDFGFKRSDQFWDSRTFQLANDAVFVEETDVWIKNEFKSM